MRWFGFLRRKAAIDGFLNQTKPGVPFETSQEAFDAFMLNAEGDDDAHIHDNDDIYIRDVVVKPADTYGGETILYKLVMIFTTAEIIIGKARDKASLEQLATDIKTELGMS